MEIDTGQIEEKTEESTPESIAIQQGQSALQNAKRLTPTQIQMQSFGTTSSADRLGGSPLQEPGTPDEFKVTGPSLGLAPDIRKFQEAQVYNYLKEEGLDMDNSYARFQASKYISKRLGLPLGSVVTDFDSIVEDITGVSIDPKTFWENVRDSWKDAKTGSEIVKLGNQIRLNPGAESNEIAMQRQAALKEEMSAYDPFEHSTLHDMGGGTAQVLPHMIEVGKWALPGAALMFLTKGGVGKTQLMTGMYVAGQLASLAGGAKAFQEGYDYAAGSIFNDLLDMKDSNGESMDINVARDVSAMAAIPYAAVESMEAILVMTGTSPLTTALKKMGEKKVVQMLNKTAIRSIYSLGLQGGFRQAAKTLTRTAVPAALGGIMSYGEEVVEEVVQLQIQIAAEEWAKVLVNEVRGTEFAPIGDDEYWDRTTTELTEAAKSMFLLQGPGMVKNTIANQLKYQKIADKEKSNAEMAEEETVVDMSENAETEVFEVVVDEIEAEEDKRTLETITVDIGEDSGFGLRTASISSKDGSQDGNLTFSEGTEYNSETKEMDPYINITNVNLANKSNVKAIESAVAEIKKQNPGVEVRFDDEIESMKAMELAIENQNPSVNFLNNSIGEYEARLKEADEVLARAEEDLKLHERTIAFDESQLAEFPDDPGVKGTAEYTRTELEATKELIAETKKSRAVDKKGLKRAEKQKADYLAKDTKPVSEMTAAEYRESASAADPDKAQFINTPEGSVFAAKIENAMPNLKGEEVASAVKMVELRAAALGKTAAEYVAQRFTEEAIVGSKEIQDFLETKRARAAMNFDKNGKVTFLFGKKSNFSSFAHELSHAFARELEGNDLEVATKWTYDSAKTAIMAQIERDKKLLPPKEAESRRATYHQELKIMDDGMWTTRMHEAFASGYELFLYTGKAESKGMKQIFLRFAEFMRRVYKSADFVGAKGLVITPDMAHVYQNLLTAKRLSDLKSGKAKPLNPIDIQVQTLFQPDLGLDAEYKGLDAYTAYQDEHLAAIYKNTDKESTIYETRRQKALKTLVEGLKNGVRAFHDPGDFEGRMIMLHPSSRDGVKWQMSLFDNYGPQGHYNAVSMADAVSLLRAENFIMENVPGPAATNPLFGGNSKTLFQTIEEEYAEMDTLLKNAESFADSQMKHYDAMIAEDPKFSKTIQGIRDLTAKRVEDVRSFVGGIKKGVRAFHDENSEKANSAFLHPSSRSPGKWQLSFFDDRGPYTHMEADSISWIAKQMLQAQYLENIKEGPHPQSSLAGPRKTLFQPDETDPRIGVRFSTGKGNVDDATGPTALGLESIVKRGYAAQYVEDWSKLIGYPKKGNLKPETYLERVVQRMTDNLLYLHDLVPSDINAESKNWYDSAHSLAAAFAAKHGVDKKTASAVIASLSPKKDWNMNVSVAARLMDVLDNAKNETYNDKLSGMVEAYIASIEKPASKAVVQELYDGGKSKKLSEMSDLEAALFYRFYDTLHNEKGYRLVRTDGTFGGYALKLDGGRSKVMPNTFVEFAKAISLYRDGTIENISANVSKQPKVRSFYNNIAMPWSDRGEVTIDTHAVAAAQLRPLGLASQEVLWAFGSTPGFREKKSTGVHGSSAIYAEAYRRAAAERGILPRQMQSITWVAAQRTFSPDKKSNDKTIDGMWSKIKGWDVGGIRDEIKQHTNAEERIRTSVDLEDDIRTQDALYTRIVDGTESDGDGWGEYQESVDGPGVLERSARRSSESVSNTDGLLFQPAEELESEAFKTWFSSSKIVDNNGNPIIFHHGTTHKFDAFNRARANVENDMGQGFYFSNTRYDVEANYEGVGPDLTARIDQLAESLLYDMNLTPEEFGFEPGSEVEYEDAQEEARKQLAGDTPHVIDVYLSITNPVVLGSAVSGMNTKETYFEMDQEQDSDEEFTGEASGSLVDLAEALREVAWDFIDVDIEPVIAELFEDADYQVISAAQTVRLLKQSSGIQYAIDENSGSMASAEIIRRAFEVMGFDGIMDYTVNEKFGSQKRIGNGMEGMNEDTVHVIAFDPGSIKQIDNTGTWNRDDDRMLFQPSDEEYIAAVQDAVEKGYDVPMQVLKQFPGESWATREIEKRRQIEEMPFWVEEAVNAADYEGFKEALSKGEKTNAQTDEWLRDFYRRATATPLNADINVGHKEWLDGLTDDAIIEIATKISGDMKKARDAGYPVSVLALANRIIKKGDINEKSIRTIRKTFQNNPSKYRLMTAELTGDKKLEAKTKKETELSELMHIKDESLRDPKVTDRMALVNELEDVRLKDLVQKGNISTFETVRLFNESEDQLIADDKEIDALNKKAKTDKSEAVKTAVKKALAKRRAHEKDMKAKKKLKDHARAIGEFIKRPIPNSIAIEQRVQIQAIKDLIDPNFRRKTSAQLKKELLAGEISPTKEFLDRIGKRSLGEIPIEELMYIKDYIKALSEFGRGMERIRKAKELDIVNGWVRDIRGSMLRNVEETGDDDKVIARTGLSKGENAMKLFLATLRPSRIADWIDGSQDFNGAAHRFFIDEINKAYNEELRQKQRREHVVGQKMKDLGITRSQLEKSYKMFDERFSVDAIMDIYAGMKNEQKAEALILGNNITKEKAEALIKLLTPDQIKLADTVIQEYQDNYERLRDAFRDYTNKELGQEENYTPILRSSWSYAADEIKITDELLHRRSLQRTSVAKGFTEQRKIITDKLYQAPIQLGLVSSWGSQVAQQEHYINMGRTITRANRVLGDASIKAAAEASGKRAHLVQMDGYIKRVANPSIYKSLRNVNGVVKELRNRSAIAYLALNTVTMLKQVPSLAFYMAYTTPTAMLGALGQMTMHPFKTMELVQSLDPQMKERSIERYIEELKVGHKGKFQHIIDQIGLQGLKGIMLFDKIATTAGWMAVYNHNMQHGLSEQESIRMARMATLNTQPAAAAKDIAAIYADDGLLSIFLQFTNQLNQIWNMAVWDAPQALKNKHYMRAIAMYGGMTLSAMAMWTISNRRLPEDDEDFFDIWSDQMLATIPIVGRVMASEMDGYEMSIPVLAPFTAGGQILKYAKKGVFNPEDISEAETERMLKSLHEGLSIATGVPYTAANRLKKGIQNDTVIPSVLLGGPWNEQE